MDTIGLLRNGLYFPVDGGDGKDELFFIALE